ncbi:MAG TPA: hydroxymethylbilane synthase [Gemmatimonadales bacterium]|nr:hydroxymethylbilane synthase [Gemmatimonadales bacterium]
MQPPPLRIGTRASALALWQTERVRARLADCGYRTERVEIRTSGDVVQDVPLSHIGERALFTKQLDDALLERRIDVAVHSLKDLPTRLPDGIALAAVGLREDPRDALVARGGFRWSTLPEGAVVATSSLRRRSQLLWRRRDLQVVDIRGNVDTRLAKLERTTNWSAIVLASAGLIRLGLEARISERLPFDVMLPAPGQGALAATARTDDTRTGEALRRALHEPAVELTVVAERAFLRALEGGCQVPIAATAHLVDESGGRSLRLRGRVLSLGGEECVEGTLATASLTADAADTLGTTLAHELLREGAGRILESIRSAVRREPVPEP